MLPKQKAPPTGGALKCSFVAGRNFALVAHRRMHRARRDFALVAISRIVTCITLVAHRRVHRARRVARTRELTPPREQQQSRR